MPHRAARDQACRQGAGSWCVVLVERSVIWTAPRSCSTRLHIGGGRVVRRELRTGHDVEAAGCAAGSAPKMALKRSAYRAHASGLSRRGGGAPPPPTRKCPPPPL